MRAFMVRISVAIASAAFLAVALGASLLVDTPASTVAQSTDSPGSTPLPNSDAIPRTSRMHNVPEAVHVSEVRDGSTELGSSSVDTGLVYIIRHGEKSCLICCLDAVGKARAAALPRVFDSKNASNNFDTPRALVAFRYGGVVNCERTEETLKPISKQLNETIDTSLTGGIAVGNAAAARGILGILSRTGGPVLVAWEHANIQYLARGLGVPTEQIEKWSSSDFDSVYVVTYALPAEGTAPVFQSFAVESEGLGDSRLAKDKKPAFFFPFVDGVPTGDP